MQRLVTKVEGTQLAPVKKDITKLKATENNGQTARPMTTHPQTHISLLTHMAGCFSSCTTAQKARNKRTQSNHCSESSGGGEVTESRSPHPILQGWAVEALGGPPSPICVRPWDCFIFLLCAVPGRCGRWLCVGSSGGGSDLVKM